MRISCKHCEKFIIEMDIELRDDIVALCPKCFELLSEIKGEIDE